MDVQFTQTAFRAGYDQELVDDFLDRCEQALATGDGSMTERDVLEAQFPMTRFSSGYDVDEVDRFLDEVLVQRFRALGTVSVDGSGTSPSGQAQAGTPGPAQAHGGPVPAPAEQRGGFLSRLFGGR